MVGILQPLIFLLGVILSKVTTSNNEDGFRLKILSYNIWGLPIETEMKPDRINALSDFIKKGDHDIYLLQELWEGSDHRFIENSLPTGYTITSIANFADDSCTSAAFFSNYMCSGLAVISKYPFDIETFHEFQDCGQTGIASLIDGECLVGKGIGQVRLSLKFEDTTSVSVDVFNTHTTADVSFHQKYLKSQIKSILNGHVLTSKADLVILGGDFNIGPDDAIYATITKNLKDVLTEKEGILSVKDKEKFATYGNPNNSFSGHAAPLIIDHIFFKNNSDQFEVSIQYLEVIDFNSERNGGKFSLSDHSAISCTIGIKPKDKRVDSKDVSFNFENVVSYLKNKIFPFF